MGFPAHMGRVLPPLILLRDQKKEANAERQTKHAGNKAQDKMATNRLQQHKTTDPTLLCARKALSTPDDRSFVVKMIRLCAHCCEKEGLGHAYAQSKSSNINNHALF